jgi:hypothetical protein
MITFLKAAYALWKVRNVIKKVTTPVPPPPKADKVVETASTVISVIKALRK